MNESKKKCDKNTWNRSMPGIGSLVTLLATSFLVGCGNDTGREAPDVSDSTPTNPEAEVEARYREKVKRRVSASVVSSFSREWGVPESKIECLLADLSVTQLEDAATDTVVAAVFGKCDVDPAVAE
jgi:hypothetical protein